MCTGAGWCNEEEYGDAQHKNMQSYDRELLGNFCIHVCEILSLCHSTDLPYVLENIMRRSIVLPTSQEVLTVLAVQAQALTLHHETWILTLRQPDFHYLQLQPNSHWDPRNGHGKMHMASRAIRESSIMLTASCALGRLGCRQLAAKHHQEIHARFMVSIVKCAQTLDFGCYVCHIVQAS